MKNELQTSRRLFLKKTAYVAPALMTLGALAPSAQANASGPLVTGPVKDETGTVIGQGSAPKGTPIGTFLGGF